MNEEMNKDPYEITEGKIIRQKGFEATFCKSLSFNYAKINISIELPIMRISKEQAVALSKFFLRIAEELNRTETTEKVK